MKVEQPETPNFCEEEAASFLCLSVSALRKSRMNGAREGHLPPPPFVKLGRRVIYRRSDLEDYLQANLVEADAKQARTLVERVPK